MCIITLEHSPSILTIRWLLFYAIGELVKKGKYEVAEERSCAFLSSPVGWRTTVHFLLALGCPGRSTISREWSSF